MIYDNDAIEGKSAKKILPGGSLSKKKKIKLYVIIERLLQSNNFIILFSSQLEIMLEDKLLSTTKLRKSKNKSKLSWVKRSH